jgi:hypothetical protein
MSVTNRELLEAYARMASQAYDYGLTGKDQVNPILIKMLTQRSSGL